MNFIIFSDFSTFRTALNVLALTNLEYVWDEDELSISSEDIDGVVDYLAAEGITDFRPDASIVKSQS